MICRGPSLRPGSARSRALARRRTTAEYRSSDEETVVGLSLRAWERVFDALGERLVLAGGIVGLVALGIAEQRSEHGRVAPVVRAQLLRIPAFSDGLENVLTLTSYSPKMWRPSAGSSLPR